MERLRQNKARKKWKEAEKVASQSATKSQAPSKGSKVPRIREQQATKRRLGAGYRRGFFTKGSKRGKSVTQVKGYRWRKNGGKWGGNGGKRGENGGKWGRMGNCDEWVKVLRSLALPLFFICIPLLMLLSSPHGYVQFSSS